MDHGPAIEHEEDFASEYKTRLGLRFFAVYGALYLGFILINVVAPETMERTLFMGINLAVGYGYGLIIAAIVMGLLYNRMSTKKEQELAKEREDA